MNTLKTTAEDFVVAIINIIRETVTPIFNKYTVYHKYIDFFIYGVYAFILFGFYNTVPAYIPMLRSAILYIAVIILLVRFNRISWNNPKFAILGGNTFSEFDRRLIVSMCVFILITHFVSEKVIDYTKKQIKQRVTVPIQDAVIHPIYNIIDDTRGGPGRGVGV
jgi:hypothetical protein